MEPSTNDPPENDKPKYDTDAESLMLLADTDPEEAESLRVYAQARARERLPEDWAEILKDEFAQPYWSQLQRYVAAERANDEVYPAPEDVFAAFHLTPYQEVRVVIVGQDPYFNPDQAHGLCFSVPEGVSKPPSLRNILRELNTDLDLVRSNGDLSGWARQGVLLLNSTLTVRRGDPDSHTGHGWETFTDAVIRAVNDGDERVVFVLWGGPAQGKERLIDISRHVLVKAAHPVSWPNALVPFRDSEPFLQINAALRGDPIDWLAS